MGLSHSTYRAYGFEIPATTDFERLGHVRHTYLGDFEQLFLLAVCDEVEANAFARIAAADFERYELPVWNTALHNIAVRLGHPLHPEPAWLVLHDHS